MYAALGASPVAIPGAQAYTALQTHVADAAATTVEIMYAQHYYEILKYLTMTNHSWSTYILLANADVWRTVPDKMKGIITRNIEKAATLQRVDAATDQKGLVTKLADKGIIVNTIDTRVFSSKLGAYYAKYKQVYGPDVWALVERAVGKLG
jgi:TRAP-type C4-dicarboxylate transport system substrate-binding protein